jgi:gamma-glutamylaminecyclotransferase
MAEETEQERKARIEASFGQDTEAGKDEGIRVFVYGTLKAGHPNHGPLEGAEFLGRCFIEGEYTLLNLGWYPGLVAAGKGKVFGEVYRVDDDTLHTLDIVEGHPEFYERKKITTPWKKAWTYFLPPEYLEENEVVADGCWEPSDEEEEFRAGVN